LSDEASDVVVLRSLIVKAELVVLVNPLDEATNVYPMPLLLMDRLLNVATPFMAVTGVVPLKIPELGFVPMAMATGAELVVTRLLKLSRTWTVTAGVIEEPALVVVGCCANASLLAAAAVMSNGELTVEVSPELEAERVYPVAAFVMFIPEKVAVPATAA
jgi:hypothetical protein